MLHQLPVYQTAGENDNIGMSQQSRTTNRNQVDRSRPGTYKRYSARHLCSPVRHYKFNGIVALLVYGKDDHVKLVALLPRKQ
jgi:hypothetical protein